eukprot:1143308-Pelagomonas_calceolata.AAC.2
MLHGVGMVVHTRDHGGCAVTKRMQSQPSPSNTAMGFVAAQAMQLQSSSCEAAKGGVERTLGCWPGWNGPAGHGTLLAYLSGSCHHGALGIQTV